MFDITQKDIGQGNIGAIAKLNSPDRLDGALTSLKGTLMRYQGVIGPAKLKLFFSPEIQGKSQEGWHTTRMVVKEGKEGEIIFKRIFFLDNHDRDESLDSLYKAILPEYGSEAFVDTDPFIVDCTLRQIRGKTIVQFNTTGPAKYILNKSDDPRMEDFSTVNDPKFEQAVGGGGVVTEKFFISPDDDKISRFLTAHIDLDPSEDIQVQTGIGKMTFDSRDFQMERHMRKVERKLDGSLIVADGRLIEGKQFIWDSTRVLESANQVTKK